MRIAFVVTGGVDPSGREHVIPALLSFIERQARRSDFVVYALRYFDRPRSYPLLGATVHDLGRPEGIRRQYSALVERLERDGPFDVVHAYWALPAGLAATLSARRLGVPSVVTLNSGEFVAIPDIHYGLQRRWRQRLAVKATLKVASRLTVGSLYQERLARAYGARPEVIPLGVDTRVFTPATRGTAPFSQGPPWRLLHVANLNPVKDQSTLIEALRRLLDREPRVHLDIVGEDTLGGSMQALAHRLGVDAHVTFHGHQPTDSLVGFYQRAHLAILSSRHDAAPVVVLEAAACGVATVGSAVGYVADWTPDAALGVPPHNPQALADAVADLLLNHRKRDRIAAAAHEWTLAHDADWTAVQFDRVYRELAATRH